MLFKRKTTAINTAPKTMHLQVKLWIVELYYLNQTFYNYLRFQLFPNLTFQCLFWHFPWLHLTTRKLPAILIISVSPLCSKNTTFIIMNNCRDGYNAGGAGPMFFVFGQLRETL